MIALKILAVTLITGLILFFLNSLTRAFNERCQQKFYTKLITFKSFVFVFLALVLLLAGGDIAAFAKSSHMDLISGIALCVIGISGLCLLIWDNFQKTNLVCAAIAFSALFISAFLLLFFFWILFLLGFTAAEMP